jgi:hypothetical protein
LIGLGISETFDRSKTIIDIKTTVVPWFFVARGLVEVKDLQEAWPFKELGGL